MTDTDTGTGTGTEIPAGTAETVGPPTPGRAAVLLVADRTQITMVGCARCPAAAVVAETDDAQLQAVLVEQHGWQLDEHSHRAPGSGSAERVWRCPEHAAAHAGL